MKETSYKIVRTIGFLIPIAVIALSAYLNAAPSPYAYKTIQTLDQFSKNIPDGYFMEQPAGAPHSSLTGPCGIFSADHSACGADSAWVSFTRQDGEGNEKLAKNCPLFIDWAIAHGAKYWMTPTNQYMDVTSNRVIAHQFCVNNANLSLVGKLDGKLLAINFDTMNIGVNLTNENADFTNLADYQTGYMNGLGEDEQTLANALNSIGEYRAKHKLSRNLTAAEMAQALAIHSDKYTKLLKMIKGDDGKIAFLKEKNPVNTDFTFCLMVTPWDKAATGIEDPGTNYLTRSNGLFERFGDWTNSETCPPKD